MSDFKNLRPDFSAPELTRKVMPDGTVWFSKNGQWIREPMGKGEPDAPRPAEGPQSVEPVVGKRVDLEPHLKTPRPDPSIPSNYRTEGMEIGDPTSGVPDILYAETTTHGLTPPTTRSRASKMFPNLLDPKWLSSRRR